MSGRTNRKRDWTENPLAIHREGFYNIAFQPNSQCWSRQVYSFG